MQSMNRQAYMCEHMVVFEDLLEADHLEDVVVKMRLFVETFHADDAALKKEALQLYVQYYVQVQGFLEDFMDFHRLRDYRARLRQSAIQFKDKLFDIELNFDENKSGYRRRDIERLIEKNPMEADWYRIKPIEKMVAGTLYLEDDSQFAFDHMVDDFALNRKRIDTFTFTESGALTAQRKSELPPVHEIKYEDLKEIRLLEKMEISKYFYYGNDEEALYRKGRVHLFEVKTKPGKRYPEAYLSIDGELPFGITSDRTLIRKGAHREYLNFSRVKRIVFD